MTLDMAESLIGSQEFLIKSHKMENIKQKMDEWEKENMDKISGWTVEWKDKPYTKIITFSYKEDDVKKTIIFEIPM